MFTQFVNYIQKNVGTTAVTLVTCPASNQLVVNQLSCANTTGFLVTCSVTVTRAGTTAFIVNSADVPAGGSLICAGNDQKIVLMAGDIIQIRSSLANSIDAVVSGVLNDFNRSAVVPVPVIGPIPPPPQVPSSTRAFSVAQSTSRGIYTTNGTTWTETTLPSSGIWLDTNYNPASPGRACALRWGGAIYSTDYGQTWTAATGMGGGDGSVEKLAPVTSTVWITVGTGTTNYYRSTDNGQTWTVLNFGSVYNGRAVAGIGAGLAVIVTNSQTYYTTTDGLTFTPGTFPATPDSSTNWNRIEYVNGLYIAMQGVANGRYIMTSPNGTTWTVRDVSLGASYGGQLRDISFGGALPGTWLIVNDFPTVYFTSTDLVTWTSRTLPTARRWSGIAWIGGQWVAIVDDAAQNIKAVSTDGITWVESALTTSGARWSDLTEVR